MYRYEYTRVFLPSKTVTTDASLFATQAAFLLQLNDWNRVSNKWKYYATGIQLSSPTWASKSALEGAEGKKS